MLNLSGIRCLLHTSGVKPADRSLSRLIIINKCTLFSNTPTHTNRYVAFSPPEMIIKGISLHGHLPLCSYEAVAPSAPP